MCSRRLCAYVGLNFVKHRLAPPGGSYHGSSLTNPLLGIVDEGALSEVFGTRDAYVAFHNAYLRRYGAQFYAFDEERFYAALHPRRLTPDGQWLEANWVSEL